MKPLRIYVDTSVFGGCFDAEFAEDSKRLFEAVRKRKLVIVVSEIVLKELEVAPVDVRGLLETLPLATVEPIALSPEIVELRDAYLAAGVVGARWTNDATHVAAATVVRADAIVSWNFTHLVRLDKIKGYNQVNFVKGYGIIAIVSPKEVVVDEPTEE